MKKLLLLSLIIFPFLNFSQTKELISVWEKKLPNKHHKVEVFFESGAKYPATSTFTWDIYTEVEEKKEYLLEFDGKYIIFYNSKTLKESMYVEIREVNGEDRMYFNGTSNYFVKRSD